VKRITMALMIMSLVCTVGVYVSQAATIPFDDVVSGSSSYSVDVTGDTVPDVVFTTSNPSGFGTVPNVLEGGILSGDWEVVVQFLGGATGSLAFDFGVTSEHSSYPEAYIIVPHPTVSYRWVSEQTQVTGTPAYGSLSITLADSVGAFTAETAYIQFYAGSGNRFMMDNFTGNFGAAKAPVPEPTTMLLLGTGLIGLVGFRKKFKK
jgi:hypothetical protein